MSRKILKSLILMGFAAVSTWCGNGIILHNRTDNLNAAANDLGDAAAEIRRENEANRRADIQERRQASLDSMQRINDSLSAELKRLELKRKRQELDQAYWKYLRDSVKAARAEEKRKTED